MGCWPRLLEMSLAKNFWYSPMSPGLTLKGAIYKVRVKASAFMMESCPEQAFSLCEAFSTAMD